MKFAVWAHLIDSRSGTTPLPRAGSVDPLSHRLASSTKLQIGGEQWPLRASCPPIQQLVTPKQGTVTKGGEPTILLRLHGGVLKEATPNRCCNNAEWKGRMGFISETSPGREHTPSPPGTTGRTLNPTPSLSCTPSRLPLPWLVPSGLGLPLTTRCLVTPHPHRF